ncbi:MAG: tetratricopeptide repeat protein, partial [Actinomycetota bacterium]
SGFLEGPARDHYLELAREAFEGAMESGDGSLPLRLARVHLMLGEIAEAARLLDELSRRHPDDAEVRLLRMEVIYEFGDFRELSVYARRALPSLPEDSGRRPVVAWWAGEEEAEAAGAL